MSLTVDCCFCNCLPVDLFEPPSKPDVHWDNTTVDMSYNKLRRHVCCFVSLLLSDCRPHQARVAGHKSHTSTDSLMFIHVPVNITASQPLTERSDA